MNSDLTKLFEMQQVDAEIARLAAEVAASPKRVTLIESQLASSNEKLEKAKAAIKTDEVARRGYEGDIKSQQDKIAKFRDQSSAVKTNDQYKALLQEITFGEKAIRELEDKILETMELSEKKNSAVKEAEALLKTESVAVEKEKEEARARTAKDEAELRALFGKRSKLRVGINEDLLAHYERIHKHRGYALAEAKEQRCTGCQVMLRPQVFNELMNDIVHTCDSCSRILFYDPAHAEPEKEVKGKGRGGKSASVALERSWVYLPDRSANGIFAVLTNAKGSCSLRIYDATSGRSLEPIQRVKGQIYQKAFSEYVSEGRPLFVYEIPDLESIAKEELPAELLSELQSQVPDRGSAGEVVQ